MSEISSRNFRPITAFANTGGERDCQGLKLRQMIFTVVQTIAGSTRKYSCFSKFRMSQASRNCCQRYGWRCSIDGSLGFSINQKLVLAEIADIRPDVLNCFQHVPMATE